MRPGRRVRQALQGQRAALQVDPPRVVGEVAVADPPRASTRPCATCGRWPRRRSSAARVGRPGQRDEARVALLHRRARDGAVPLEAEAQVGGRAAARPRRPRPSPAPVRSPRPRRPSAPARAVVERGLAVEVELDRAAQALDRAQQAALGLGVGAAGAVASARLSRWYQGPISRASRTMSQPVLVIHVVSSTCVPGQVAASAGDRVVGGPDAEPACGAVQQRGEHARRRRAGAGTATRRCRQAPPARCAGSPRGRRTRRWAGTDCPPDRSRARHRAGVGLRLGLHATAQPLTS